VTADTYLQMQVLPNFISFDGVTTSKAYLAWWESLHVWVNSKAMLAAPLLLIGTTMLDMFWVSWQTKRDTLTLRLRVGH